MFSTLKLLGATALILTPVAAMAKPDVKLTLTRYTEKKVVAADGSETLVRELPSADSKTAPGDPVIYVLSYVNKGDEAAAGVTFADDLPLPIEYVSSDDANATVSVDGGKTWGNLADLKVAVEGAEPRAATPSDVTHIRWTVANIAPGESGSVSYRARVR